MSTQPTAIAASPPAMSNYDMIGEALRDPEPSQAESTEASTDPVPAETQTETSTEQPEVTETGEQAEVTADATAAEPEQQADDNPYEREDNEEFKPQTLSEIIKTPEGRRMYAHDKAMRALGKPVEQGGIHHIPTVEQIKQYYGDHRELALMTHDLNSGNPEQASRLLGHLFDARRGESVHTVASQLIPTLAKANPAALSKMLPQLASLEKINPAAYQEAGVPFVTSYGKALWNRVEAMPDPPKWEGSLKQALYYAAQAVHKDLTGDYRKQDGQPVQAVQSQDDPLSQKAAELAEKEERIAAFEQRQREAAARQWTSDFGKQVETNLLAELDKALVPLKKLYEATPAKYDRARKFFHDQIVSDVPRNKEAFDLYQVRVADARRSGSPEKMEAAAKEYVRLAVPVIMAKRKAFLEEEGVAVQNQSNQRHAELRSIDSKAALNRGSAPLNPSKGEPLTKQPGESQADFNLRQLRA